MAIKIAGTTVIDDNKKFVNVASEVGSYDLLDTRTITNASSVDFTQVFDGTYDRYVVVGEDCAAISSSALPGIRVYSNNSLITSSDYRYTRNYDRTYFTSTVQNSGNIYGTTTTNTGYLSPVSMLPKSDNNRSNFNIYINQPNASSLDTHLITFDYSHTNDTYFTLRNEGIIRITQGSNFTIDGIQVLATNAFEGTLKLYGVK